MRATVLFGPVVVHLVKPGARNYGGALDLHHGDQIHNALQLHGLVVMGHTQQDRTQ